MTFLLKKDLKVKSREKKIGFNPKKKINGHSMIHLLSLINSPLLRGPLKRFMENT